MGRLLNDEEIEDIDIECGLFSSEKPDEYNGDHYFYERALIRGQDAKTLKAVGEWLKTHITYRGGIYLRLRIKNEDWEILLRGEMPE